MHRRELGEEAALAAIGAAVEHEPSTSRDQRAVAAGTRFELDDHPLPPVVGSDELLPAREHELDRPSGSARECCDVALEVEVALRAEAAAEQRHDHPDLRLRDPEHVRDAAARGERHLRRRPDRYAVSLPLRDDRARLDRGALRSVGDVAAGDDDVRALHRSVGVAFDDRGVAEHVALPAERLVALVGIPVRVHERGVRGKRRLDVRHRRQRLVLDLDQPDRLLGELRRRGRDGGDDVALEPHLLLREQAPVLDELAVANVRHVLVGQYREDSRQRPCARRVDADDACARVVGVAKPGMELTRQVEVGRVAAGPGHLLLAVRADECPPLLRRRHAASSLATHLSRWLSKHRRPARSAQPFELTTVVPSQVCGFPHSERPPPALTEDVRWRSRQAATGTGSGRTITVSATGKMSDAGMPARAACSRIFSSLDA